MNHLLSLLCVGFWIGLVVGLSFVEAPLKFQAPGISVELGLGIGRLVFGALNKIEIVLGFLLLLFYWKQYPLVTNTHLIFLAVLYLILITQSLFLLPELNERVGLILEGHEVASSWHHLIFIFLEILKVIVLSTLFVLTYRMNP